MSTKTTRKYVNTEIFSLHLYDDFAGPSALEIRVNNSKVTMSLTKEEAEDITQQLTK